MTTTNAKKSDSNFHNEKSSQGDFFSNTKRPKK